MRAKIQDTYNIQVVEEGSHSFGFCFPPEGDFAPEAHHTPAHPQKRYRTRQLKKQNAAETQGSGFQKQLKLQEKELL